MAFGSRFPPGDLLTPGRGFGKICSSWAATTIEEKFSDAAQVNALTGASPTVALHCALGSAGRQGGCSGDTRAGEEVWREGGVDQSESVSGCG